MKIIIISILLHLFSFSFGSLNAQSLKNDFTSFQLIKEKFYLRSLNTSFQQLRTRQESGDYYVTDGKNRFVVSDEEQAKGVMKFLRQHQIQEIIPLMEDESTEYFDITKNLISERNFGSIYLIRSDRYIEGREAGLYFKLLSSKIENYKGRGGLRYFYLSRKGKQKKNVFGYVPNQALSKLVTSIIQEYNFETVIHLKNNLIYFQKHGCPIKLLIFNSMNRGMD